MNLNQAERATSNNINRVYVFELCIGFPSLLDRIYGRENTPKHTASGRNIQT